MKSTAEISSEPRHTVRWFCAQGAFTLVASLLIAIIAEEIGHFASVRFSDKLLTEASFELFKSSTPYGFVVVAISLLSITLIEIAYRKRINYLQYGLIAVVLGWFYLMLLALSEFLVFAASYSIVSVMAIGLVAWFVKEITKNMKAAQLTAGILLAEYVFVFLLVNMGSAVALMAGSLALFILIALAMYFTLKLKIVDDELIIK